MDIILLVDREVSNMKKLLIFLLVLSMSLFMCSCQESVNNKEYKYFLTVSDTVITLEKNEQAVITAQYSDNKTAVSFLSTDASVANVNSNGTVSAVGEGTCYIVISAGGQEKTCFVTVLDPVYTAQIVYPEETLIVGAKTNVVVLIYRDGVKINTKVDWTVSDFNNCDIQELDDNTIVFTGLKEGEYTLKADANKCSVECVLRVVAQGVND